LKIANSGPRLSAVARCTGPTGQRAAASWPPLATPTAWLKALSGQRRASRPPLPHISRRGPTAPCARRPRCRVPTASPAPPTFRCRLATRAAVPTAAVQSRRRPFRRRLTPLAVTVAPCRRLRAVEPPSPMRRCRAAAELPCSVATCSRRAPRVARAGRAGPLVPRTRAAHTASAEAVGRVAMGQASLWAESEFGPVAPG
jgi:hypothetical protein